MDVFNLTTIKTTFKKSRIKFSSFFGHSKYFYIDVSKKKILKKSKFSVVHKWLKKVPIYFSTGNFLLLTSITYLVY